MASVIKATFKVDGQEAEVVALSYSFDQNVDNIGQPAGEVRGGIIKVTLGSLGSEKRFGWAVTSDMKKSGEIEFTDANGKTLKTLKFEDAYWQLEVRIENFSTNDLNDPKRFRFLGNQPLWPFIAKITYEHEARFLPMLEAYGKRIKAQNKG